MTVHELQAWAICSCGAEHDRRGTGESGNDWFARHVRIEAVAEVLRRHRTTHDPDNGAARCDCGWVGPFTRVPGLDASHHLAQVLCSEGVQ